MSPRLLLYGIAGLALLGALFVFPLLRTDNYSWANKLTLNGKTYSLLIADTSGSRAHGLSDRDSLSQDEAMLFIFPDADRYGFWMKDMKFSIDMIWIDDQHKIVYIEPNVSPSTYPTVFTPPENSLYVLEANAGFAEENNLKVGNYLNFTLK